MPSAAPLRHDADTITDLTEQLGAYSDYRASAQAAHAREMATPSGYETPDMRYARVLVADAYLALAEAHRRYGKALSSALDELQGEARP